jgi:hypothetical protein
MHRHKDINQNLTLFVLAHFHVLCPISRVHPICLFLSLVDDMHIVGLALDVVLIFLQL